MPQPAAVTALITNFTDDLAGATVTAEHRTGIRWRLTAASDRVTVWADYDARSHGRMQLKTSKLYIDGEEVPRVDSYAALIRVFADPDNGREIPEEDPNPAEVDPQTAPEEVQRAYHLLAGKSPAGMRVLVRNHNWRWYVCQENDRIQLAIVFGQFLIDHQRPLRGATVGLVRKDPVRLTIDGEDLTGMVRGRLDKAMGLIAGHPAAAAPPAVAGESPAARNTGVEMRRQIVIRN